MNSKLDNFSILKFLSINTFLNELLCLIVELRLVCISKLLLVIISFMVIIAFSFLSLIPL